jgi:hypothetical protein
MISSAYFTKGCGAGAIEDGYTEMYFENLDDLFSAIKNHYSHYFELEQAEKDALAGKMK